MTNSTQSVEAVVLAAGRSSRMGQPKQLLPLPGGDAVIERVVGNVVPFVSDVVVVVGHVPGQVAAMAERAGARIAINPQVDRGMLSSVQAGIAALHEATTGILLCLGDQPEVDERTIVPVLDAATETSLVIPTFEGKGGHPVYIGQTFFSPQAETGRMDGGASVLLLGNGDGTFRPLLPCDSGLVVAGDLFNMQFDV